MSLDETEALRRQGERMQRLLRFLLALNLGLFMLVFFSSLLH